MIELPQIHAQIHIDIDRSAQRNLRFVVRILLIEASHAL